MNNVKVHFEALHNATASNRVEFKGKISTLYDVLMSMKVNKALLFIVIVKSQVDVVVTYYY